MTEGTEYFCSFCAKSNHAVKKMIAGPDAFICDECVDLCIDIVTEERKAASAWAVVEQRLTAFASTHGIKPTLGLLGEIAWVLDVDFDFKLTRRPAQGMQLREDTRSVAEAEGLQPGAVGMRPELVEGKAGRFEEGREG